MKQFLKLTLNRDFNRDLPGLGIVVTRTSWEPEHEDQ